jgi:hypothetical protein
VAAASTLSELLDAANEHLRLAAQSSGFKLGIGRIAHLHKIGKQWHSDASARSAGSSGARSGGISSNGPSSARSYGSSSSSSSPMVSVRGASRTVVPRPVPPRAALQPAAATVAVARASLMSATATRASVHSDAARGVTDSAHAGQQHGLAEQASLLQAAVPAQGVAAACRGSTLGQQASCATDVSVGVAAGRMSVCSAGSAGRSKAAPDSASSCLSSHISAVANCSSDSNRLPPPTKVPLPQLQPPSAAAVAALPMPSLPQLLDLSHEPVKVLQARLERVWAILGTPAEQQLDMVLRWAFCLLRRTNQAVQCSKLYLCYHMHACPVPGCITRSVEHKLQW